MPIWSEYFEHQKYFLTILKNCNKGTRPVFGVSVSIVLPKYNIVTDSVFVLFDETRTVSDIFSDKSEYGHTKVNPKFSKQTNRRRRVGFTLPARVCSAVSGYEFLREQAQKLMNGSRAENRCVSVKFDRV